MMNRKAIWIRSVFTVGGAILLTGLVASAASDKKPSVSLRASPAAGFSPMKVAVVAEVKGGSDDFADFYCPTIEWVWGDDTRTESSSDCEPYEPGKSTIRRHYAMSRVFDTAGSYKIEFRLKQKNKVVGAGSISIQVRPGLRDGGF